MIFLVVVVVGVILFTFYTNAACRPDSMSDSEIARLLAEPEPPEESRPRRIIWPIEDEDEERGDL